MKGVEQELSTLLLHFLQLGLLVIGCLSIFLTYISYNFVVYGYDLKRESYILGDALLSSPCLTVIENNQSVKALFSESKLDVLEADPSCIKYPNGKIIVTLLDNSKEWEIILGTFNNRESANFTIAVKLNSNDIKTAKMVVFA